MVKVHEWTLMVISNLCVLTSDYKNSVPGHFGLLNVLMTADIQDRRGSGDVSRGDSSALGSAV